MSEKKRRSPLIERFVIFLAILSLAALIACPDQGPDPDKPPVPGPEPHGATVIKGKVVNKVEPARQMDGITISAISGGNEIASGQIDARSGEYTITLPEAGIYDLRLKTQVGVLDFAYAVNAEAGKTTAAPEILLPAGALPPLPDIDTPAATTSTVTPPQGTHTDLEAASVKGNVYPENAEVVILDEGEVVAKAKASGGNFEVKNIQPGLYTVEFSSPGFATVQMNNVPVSEAGATVPLNEMLLYRSPLDGVDYDKGVIRATGIGKANPNMPPAQSALMACRAAKTIAYRNLLDTILNLRVDDSKSVRDMDTSGKAVSILQGFVRGARVVSENKHDDGTCEVTLEAPLSGSGGVTNYLRKIIK